MRRPKASVLIAAGLLALIALVLAVTRAGSQTASPSKVALKTFALEGQGVDFGGSGGESAEYLRGQTEFAEARTAPSGIVNPGAYSSAVSSLNGLSTVGTAWSDITRVPYDADDPAYRDYYSNSSGGSGLVTGRITGLAADPAGDIWAAGADGGVWRRNANASTWTDITGNVLSLSTGYLAYSGGSLWYATGEANTGGTSYVGAGVYVLTNPTSNTSWVRVGGNELESSTIHKLRFAGGKVWAATLFGVWYHSASTTSGSWTLAYAPNPASLTAPLQAYTIPGSWLNGQTFGTASSSLTNAPYKNIANDVAIDPNDSNHVIAALGWRSGDTYNGFYESFDGGFSWAKVNPTGSIPADDIGYVNFAMSADGSKLYAINESPALLNKLTGTVNSYLDGIYVSHSGSPAGPWSKIAESTKLANSGSALKQAVGGKGYGPGIQSWYNQFLLVDPTDADHVYAGLEEVYETMNGGSSWSTVGPYWNFYFSCWAPDAVYPPNGAANRCPQTTHPDQHSIAVGGSGNNKFVVVGNDGGIYKRPLNGSTNGNGNGTDWTSLNDGSIDTLQFYAVDVGNINPATHSTPEGNVNETSSTDTATTSGLPVLAASSGVLVSGGLQDNGGLLMRPGAAKMVSNFGGDGGDVLVDPNDGCNVVQEYVVLSMSVTQTCAHPNSITRPDAFLDLSQSTTFKIAPPDVNARFIAPFVANQTNIDEWLAGGVSLWTQTQGFAIRSGSQWTRAYTLANAGQTYTALAMRGNKLIGAWCGPCNNAGFTRGVTIGTRPNSSSPWTFTNYSSSTLTGLGVPLRYIGGVAIDASGNVYLGINGFSRRFTEGEGAGVGHVYSSADNGGTWSDISANFPDIPVSSVQSLPSGGLLAGTDLGVLYRAPSATNWQRVGTNFPLTVVMDVELGPDGKIYAATHGRGIWRISGSGL